MKTVYFTGGVMAEAERLELDYEEFCQFVESWHAKLSTGYEEYMELRRSARLIREMEKHGYQASTEGTDQGSEDGAGGEREGAGGADG